jgi:hypothetical protein
MTAYLGHEFVPSRTRKRDVRALICLLCTKRVEIPMRTKKSIPELLTSSKLVPCDYLSRLSPVASKTNGFADPAPRDGTFISGLQWCVDHLKTRQNMHASEDVADVIERIEGLIRNLATGDAGEYRSPPSTLPEALKVIQTLLKSAVPHPREHPTMTAAWAEAAAFLRRQGDPKIDAFLDGIGPAKPDPSLVDRLASEP